MVSISLEGNMGRILGKKWNLHVRTVGEAVRAIASNAGSRFQRAFGTAKGYIAVVDGVPVENGSWAFKKVKKSKFLSKDSKILNYYKKFKSIIFKDIKHKGFALAVSGGADSLCLAYFSKMYASEFGNKIHVLIVDHNLRKESHHEALKVKNIL